MKIQKFPSPVGELHFSINQLENNGSYLGLFPSPVGELHFSIGNIKCFGKKDKEIFPSPVGELHFSMVNRLELIEEKEDQISVPCRGTTFLNNTYNVKKLLKVSVPCRGTTFLNTQRARQQEKPRSGFRPLSGNYISQCNISNAPEMSSNAVSVPCRGTTFLNTIPTIPPPVWAHGRDCVGKIFLEK